MKKIIIVLTMLMLISFVFADVRTGSRVAVYNDKDVPFEDHDGYFDVANTNSNEVTVCTTKDKSHGYVVASVKSRELIEDAITRAQQLFVEMKGAGGYDHFGCARAKI